MVSIISKPAIATRITNQLVKTSLGTQLSRKTTSIQAFVPTMDSQPASNLPCEWKMCNNCCITGHLRRNAENRKHHKDNHLKLRKQLLTKSTTFLKQVMTKNQSIISRAINNSMIKPMTPIFIASQMMMWLPSLDSANQLETLNAENSLEMYEQMQ